MTTDGKSDSNAAGRKIDELDAITDQAWGMLEKWKKEVGTLAHDRQAPFDKAHIRGSDEFWKRLAKLHIGSQREMYHSEAGLRLTRNKALEKIAFSIGEENWAELANFFSKLPSDFKRYAIRPRVLEKRRKQQITLCNNLATMLEKSNWTDLDCFPESAFLGLLAKQVLSIEWFWALCSLRYGERTAIDATRVAKKCLYPLYYADSTKVLTRLLRGYAKALEEWKPEPEVKVFFHFAYGKLNEKEFVKRVVFFLLHKELKQQRAPNIETAIVVNIVLGLRGKNAVTANDITQMNKKTRRAYFKGAESYISWKKI